MPKVCQDGTSDYEAELTVVIGRTGRDIPREKALEYVLGYTCGNDVSARTEQFRNSQWSFSKGGGRFYIEFISFIHSSSFLGAQR